MKENSMGTTNTSGKELMALRSTGRALIRIVDEVNEKKAESDALAAVVAALESEDEVSNTDLLGIVERHGSYEETYLNKQDAELLGHYFTFMNSGRRGGSCNDDVHDEDKLRGNMEAFLGDLGRTLDGRQHPDDLSGAAASLVEDITAVASAAMQLMGNEPSGVTRQSARAAFQARDREVIARYGKDWWKDHWPFRPVDDEAGEKEG